MDRLMILGSMDEFVPLVKRARERGYYTIVCDGYADGPAKKYADLSYHVDIRQVDEIVKICKTEKINGIIASFSDILFEHLVKIASKAGLKTYCTPERMPYLRSKKKMRRMFQELEIPCAKNHVLDKGFSEDEVADLTFPLVMKPVNGYGSRGIYVVNCMEELRERFTQTAHYSIGSSQIMVEEYNTGYEFNMMNWILDGEVVTLSIADREKTRSIDGNIPQLVRLVYPSRLMDQVYEEAREIIRKVASYVGIRTGPLSMQFFYRPVQGIQVCECAGRFFGYEHELLTYSSGFSIEDLLLDYVYDENAMQERLIGHSARLPRLTGGLYFHGREGLVGSTKAAKELMKRINPLEYLLYYEEGERISHDIGAKPYLIRLDLAADNYEEMDKKSREIISQMEILDEEGENLVCYSEIPQYET